MYSEAGPDWGGGEEGVGGGRGLVYVLVAQGAITKRGLRAHLHPKKEGFKSPPPPPLLHNLKIFYNLPFLSFYYICIYSRIVASRHCSALIRSVPEGASTNDGASHWMAKVLHSFMG